MPIVTLVQQKGGSGKTTAVLGLGLAAKAAHPNRPVYVVDFDRQKSATTWIKQHELPLEVRENFTGIPDGALVLVDTPGLEPITTAEGLRRADLVIVPLRASMMDWSVTGLTMKAVKAAKKRAAWLPSQIDLKRAADRALAERTLPEAINAGAAEDWPILPPVRSLATVADFLSGTGSKSAAAEVFGQLHRSVTQLLRRG